MASDAKKWLSGYHDIEDRIAAKAEQAMRLRALLYSPRAVLSGMPKSSGDTDWTRKLVNLIVLENEIDDEIGELISKRRRIETFIANLPNERMRTIMEQRYINEWSWERIVDGLKDRCSERTVYEEHGRALQMLWIKLQGTAVKKDI